MTGIRTQTLFYPKFLTPRTSSPHLKLPRHLDLQHQLASDQELKNAQEASVAANTRKQTSWSVNVWKAWSGHRRLLSMYDCPPHLLILAKNSGELSRWLCRFVLEVRRQDGKEYPPNTLYQICCGILRYVREMGPDMDIFRQPAFSGFQKTLDSEMKRPKSCGKGSVPKRAEPISLEEENSLWEQGLLGDHSPAYTTFYTQSVHSLA